MPDDRLIGRVAGAHNRGVIRHLDTQRVARLRAHTVIGRNAGCTVQLHGPFASGTHAAVQWDGARWTLRDLASRNGTFLDGRRLAAGESVELRLGARLAFGEAGDTWEVVRADPPGAWAESLVTGRTVDADGGVVPLPSEDDPRVMVMRTADGWLCEEVDGVRAVGDRAVVVVDGVPWQLSLPVAADDTLGALRPGAAQASRLRIRTSTDPEWMQVSVWRDGWRDVPHRNAHHLLLPLAREWLRDADASPLDRGWMRVEALTAALGIAQKTLDVHVFRLRRQFTAIGVDDLVERRVGIGQVRLGVGAVELVGPEG